MLSVPDADSTELRVWPIIKNHMFWNLYTAKSFENLIWTNQFLSFCIYENNLLWNVKNHTNSLFECYEVSHFAMGLGWPKITKLSVLPVGVSKGGVAGNIIEARPFASIRSTARRQIDSKALARSILQLSKGQATTREIKFDDCSLHARWRRAHLPKRR